MAPGEKHSHLTLVDSLIAHPALFLAVESRSKNAGISASLLVFDEFISALIHRVSISSQVIEELIDMRHIL